MANLFKTPIGKDAPEQINVVIETSKGSKIKYELNKKTGKLEIDQEMKYGFPANYGFIPNTISGDGDELDVLVLNKVIKPKTVITVRPIGLMRMVDKGKSDDKVIAVPLASKVKDMSEKEKERIKYVFEHYKGLGKVKVLGFEGAEKSKKVILNSLKV